MAIKNLINKCRINFTKALCFILIIAGDPLAFHGLADAATIRKRSTCINKVISDLKGVIYSPNYPSPYPDDVECQWRIRSPPNTILKIDIQDLNITEDETCAKLPCCTEHRLTILQDGNPMVLCGNTTFKRPMLIYQPSTIIKYYSSRNNCEGRGFKLVYSMQKHTCKANQYPCMDGKCHLKSKFCNGTNVCGDGSDEAYCFHISHTYNYDAVSKEIMEMESRGSDLKAMMERWICKDGSIRCPLSPGRCYFPTTDICNGKLDCPRGEDELGCNPLCPKQLTCDDNEGCYLPVHRCNGLKNCRDSSDESKCGPEPCVAMEFTCLNGACILGTEVCDGDDDCGDGSDEENCNKVPFMRSAVVGLLTCILLFCLILGCMYQIYTSRVRVPRNIARRIEAEEPEEEFFYREPPPSYAVAVNDPRVLYPSSDMTGRFYEGNRGLRYNSDRGVRRHRRTAARESTAQNTVTQRGPGTRNLTGGNGMVADQTKGNEYEFDKPYTVQNRAVRALQAEHAYSSNPNESVSSSTSSSPSRESLTSCTSLEEIDDMVPRLRR